MWALKCVDRDGQVVYLPIVKSVVSVGRNPENHIVLADPDVSRSHARFNLSEDRLELEDTRSTNGLYVNNQRIKDKADLQNGDLIIIGSNQFTVIFKPDIPSDGDSISEAEKMVAGFEFDGSAEDPELSQYGEPTQRMSKEKLMKKIFEKSMNINRHPRIELREGEDVRQCHIIMTPEFLIGSGSECNMRLEHPDVSAKNTLIRTTNQGIFLFDLDSRAGTFLNGNRIHSIMPLTHRDLIKISDYEMRFIDTSHYGMNSMKSANLIFKIF